MQSHTSDIKRTPSTSHTPGSHTPGSASPGHHAAGTAADQTYRRKARRDIRDPPTMLSDPLDGSLSDNQSFDEDDMYGSDSDIETISLKPESEEQARSTNEYIVCNWLTTLIHSILHWKQDSELVAQLERIEMQMHRVTLMVEALGEAEGINASSFTNTLQDHLSSLPSPRSTPEIPLQVEEVPDGDC